MLKYSGIWVYQNKIWKFSHNNFKEYMTASYLNKLNFEEIIELITYGENHKKINESWYNVVSFLISLEHKEIIDWVVDNEPQILVKYDEGFIDVNTRSRILITTLENLKEKNMWFGYNGANIEALVTYCQSEKVVQYLLREIRDFKHFRSLNNALYVLGELTNTYGLDNEIKDVLINVCRAEAGIRAHEKKKALTTLGDRKYFDEETSFEIVSLFTTNENRDIRVGLYQYLLDGNLQDVYFDVFLFGLELKEKDREGITNISEIMRLEEGLLTASSVDSMIKILEHFRDRDRFERHNISENLFLETINKVSQLQNLGKYSFFDLMFELFIESKVHYALSSSVIESFFKNTGTVSELYSCIIENYDRADKYFVLKEIMNEKCVDDFYDRYINDKLDDPSLFVSYVEGLRKTSYRAQEFLDKVNEKEEKSISLYQVIDYKSRRERNTQKYFDSLFDINSYDLLIHELVELTNEDIVLGELSDLDYFLTESREDLKMLIWDLYHWNKSLKLVEFIGAVEWERYSIYCINIQLDKGVEVNKEQLSYITEVCVNMLETISIEDSITYTDGRGFSFNRLLHLVLSLGSSLNLDFDKEYIKQMLLISPFLFNEKEVSHNVFPKYLRNNLTHQEIVEIVKSNIKTGHLKGDVLEAHINYCKEYDLLFAIDLSIETCKDGDIGIFEKRTAIDYLDATKGADFILDSFIETSDKELFKYLVQKYAKLGYSRMEGILVTESKKNNDSLEYLTELISMNSKYGVAKFIEIMKSTNTIPGNSESYSQHELMSVIGEIDDIDLLPQIEEMIDIKFSGKFDDSDYFSIYGYLNSALKKLAEVDYKKVSKLVIRKIENNADNLEMISFLNYLREHIDSIYYQDKKVVYTIEGLKKMLKL